LETKTRRKKAKKSCLGTYPAQLSPQEQLPLNKANTAVDAMRPGALNRGKKLWERPSNRKTTTDRMKREYRTEDRAPARHKDALRDVGKSLKKGKRRSPAKSG